MLAPHLMDPDTQVQGLSNVPRVPQQVGYGAQVWRHPLVHTLSHQASERYQ